MIKEELNIAPNDISWLSNSQILLRELTGPGKGNVHLELNLKPKYVHCFVLSLKTVINKVILNSSLLYRGGLSAKTEF